MQSPLGCEKEFRFGFNCEGKLFVDFRQGSDIIQFMLQRSLGYSMENGSQKGNDRKSKTSLGGTWSSSSERDDGDLAYGASSSVREK